MTALLLAHPCELINDAHIKNSKKETICAIIVVIVN